MTWSSSVVGLSVAGEVAPAMTHIVVRASVSLAGNASPPRNLSEELVHATWPEQGWLTRALLPSDAR